MAKKEDIKILLNFFITITVDNFNIFMILQYLNLVSRRTE